jgi:hypothetical protein
MSPGPIDRYLDELFVQAQRLPARQARALLAEAEAHLSDARDERLARGLEIDRAEAEAVARFGAVGDLVAADAKVGRPATVRSVIASAWILGSLGAIAVGVSGVISGLFRLAGASNQWMAGGHPILGWGGANCGRWMQLYPNARTCAQAALDDKAAETVGYRIVLGVLGLLGVAVFVVARRYWPRARRWPTLPTVVVDSIATTLFAFTGAWFAGMAADAIVVGGGVGAGQWLSAAPIALGAAVYFGLRLVRDLTGSPFALRR